MQESPHAKRKMQAMQGTNTLAATEALRHLPPKTNIHRPPNKKSTPLRWINSGLPVMPPQNLISPTRLAAVAIYAMKLAVLAKAIQTQWAVHPILSMYFHVDRLVVVHEVKRLRPRWSPRCTSRGFFRGCTLAYWRRGYGDAMERFISRSE